MAYFVFSVLASPQVDGPHYAKVSSAMVNAWVTALTLDEARVKLKKRLEVDDAWKIEEVELEQETELELHPYHHRETQPQDPALQAGLLYTYQQLMRFGIGVEIFGVARNDH